MQANRTNLVRVGCLASLLLSLAVAMTLFIRYQAIAKCNENRLPLVKMEVTSDPSQSEQLIEQFRKFAFKNSFRFDVVNPDQDGNDFRIRMLRKDVEIVTRKPSTPGQFSIEFYSTGCDDPNPADIRDLVADLSNWIAELPNAMIIQK